MNVRVGILTGRQEIRFCLDTPYICEGERNVGEELGKRNVGEELRERNVGDDLGERNVGEELGKRNVGEEGKERYVGEQVVRLEQGKIRFGEELYESLYFASEGGRFTLQDVVIGIQFHWQQREPQTFAGDLQIIVEDGGLTAINCLDVEEYLCSVISSEMRAMSDVELLKAHAIISRSWLLHPMLKSYSASGHTSYSDSGHTSYSESGHTSNRIYERDHRNFDVCADDHCQRYQGLGRITSPLVREAVEATRGMVLTYDGEVCDTRFHKCCGGRTERFSTCWADVDYPYLQSVECGYCDTQDARVLRQVLNDYDYRTRDFYRWQVGYSRQALQRVVEEKTGKTFGEIEALRPLKRGASGRIYEMEIVGKERVERVGKELEIRRVLSPSHLYSSAFEVEEREDGFVLRGKGWGHGVGLCQIGAAVMASGGKSYEEILAHYFPKARLERCF